MLKKILVLVAVGMLGFSFALPVAFAARVGSANTSIVPGGLVGYWPFDGSQTNWLTGITKDMSGNSNTGQLVGMSTTTSLKPGKIGQSLNFNGTNHIDISNSASVADNLSAMSISVWYKTTNSSGMDIATKSNNSGAAGWFLGMSSGLVNLYTETDATHYHGRQVTGNATNDGKWHHAVVTLTGGGSGTITIYIDGVVQTLSSDDLNTVGSYSSPHDIWIGDIANGVPFIGQLDDVRIYNRALSTQEVNLLRTSGAANTGHSNTVTLTSGLVGYWPLDGSKSSWISGQTQDLSGNGNTGQFVGMSTSTAPVAGKVGGAMYFTGAGDRISLPVINMGTVNSASVWVNTQSNDAVILGDVMGDYFFYLDNTYVYYSANPANYVQVAHGTIPAGAWTHYAVVRNGATVTFYKNGTQLGLPQTLPGNATDDLHISSIGAYSDATHASQAKVDEVRMYNRLLSAQEVQQLYAMGGANVAHSNPSVVGNGLIGNWTFDGPKLNWATGAVIDSSGQGNSGQMIGMATSSSPVAGKIGQALNFNGSTQAVSVGSPRVYATLSAPYSVSMWFNAPAAAFDGASVHTLMSLESDGANSMYIVLSSNVNYLAFTIGPTPCYKTNVDPTPLAGKWHQVTFTYNGSGSSTNTNYSIYLDGVLQPFATAAGTCGTQGNLTNIGADGNGGTLFMGKIDDVRVYSRALSQQEAQQLYTGGR